MTQIQVGQTEISVGMQNLNCRVDRTRTAAVVAAAASLLLLSGCISFKEAALRPWEDTPIAALADIDRSIFWLADNAQLVSESESEQEVYSTLDTGWRCRNTRITRTYDLPARAPFSTLVADF